MKKTIVVRNKPTEYISPANKPNNPTGVQQQLIQKITELVPGIVAVYNIQTSQYVYVNDAVTKILGYPKKIWTTKGLPFAISLLHPDDVAKLLKENDQALQIANSNITIQKKNNIIATFEYRLKHKNGSWRWLHTDGVIFDRTPEGKVQHIMNISVDITKRKEAEIKEATNRKIAEESLRAREEQFRITWEATAEAMAVSDEAGIVLAANPAYFNLYGYTQEEVIGENFSIIFPLHQRKRVQEEYKKIFQSKKIASAVETKIVRKDGLERVVLSRYTFIRQGDKATTMLSVVHDITEQKYAEDKLRFLAEASKFLSSSLDYEKTLKTIAKLAVPHIGEWCGIDMLTSSGELQQVAVAHKDPKKVKWAKQYRQTNPPKMTDTTGAPQVIKTGRSVLYPLITDEMLTSSVKNTKELELARSLHMTSIMIVPIIIHKKAIGAISFITTETGRQYTDADLAMAEELASRAALAIENARLYENIHRELEERKRAETAFRESELHKTAFFETAIDAIITMNHKGKVLEFNPAAERIFGYTRGEALGKDMASLIVLPPGNTQHRKKLTYYLTTDAHGILNKRIEIAAKRKEGSLFPVELTIAKVPVSGKPLFTGTIQDITQRKQSEEKLKSSEERLRLALEAGQIGVWDWDAVRNILTCTDRVFDIYGVSNSTFTVTSKHFQQLIHPDDRNNVNKANQNAQQGKAPFNIVFRIITPAGEARWIASSALVTHDEQGKPIRMLGAVSDITLQKKLEQDKNDFVSIATHELKTPVTSLKAYAEVLEKKFTREGDMLSATQLGKMNAQLDKLTSLIADLLDATKIESGKLQMHEEQFNFDELVKEIVEELQRTTEKHTLIIQGNSKKEIYADRERTGQVLTNLISNAIKYSPHTANILIQPTATTKQVRLCVKDFGVGIPNEKKHSVFERFYRVSGPKEITFPGLGLGLYISSEIVKRQGGKIWVESDLGKGSTFCFTLPIKKVAKNH